MGQIYVGVGLMTEGTTDERFLESVVKRTLMDVAYECKGDIDIDLQTIKKGKGTFVK